VRRSHARGALPLDGSVWLRRVATLIRGRFAHGASLPRFLIFCKRLAGICAEGGRVDSLWVEASS
jgi:hypothetical protein